MNSRILPILGLLFVAATPAVAQFSQLTITRVGSGSGTVTATAPSTSTIVCPDVCARTYQGGTTVTLTANPAPGTAFSWSGAGTTSPGTPLSRTVVMPFIGNANVTAMFGSVPQMLNLSRSGNGSVAASAEGASTITCPTTCSGSFAVGSTVTLDAIPGVADSDSARTRIVWSGPVPNDGNPRQPLIMPGGAGAVSVGANFIQQFKLALTVAGSGRVTSSSSGVSGAIDCANAGVPSSSTTCDAFFDQTQQFPLATYVILVATPEPGWRVAWSGDAVASGNAFVNPTDPNQCQVSLLFAAQNLTATFTPLPTGLYVTKTGNGMGTVTSVPSGINCGTDCEETTGSPGFGPGDLVTLSAVAAPGSVFTGWSGDGFASILDPQDRSVRILADTIHNVSARFERTRLTLTKSGPGQGTVTTIPASTLNCPVGCSVMTVDYATPQLVTLTNVPVAPWFAAGWTVGGVTYPGDAITLNVMGPTNVVALYSYRPGSVDAGYFAPSGTMGAGEVTAMEALPGCRLLIADGRVLRVHQAGFNFVEAPGFHTNAVNGIITALRRLTNGPNAGKIMVGGSFTAVDTVPPSGTGPLDRIGLLRLLPDGTVDPSFETPAPGIVRCLLQQADGKALVGGNGIARLNLDGTVDAAFSAPALTDPLGNPGSVRSMNFQTVDDSDYLLIAGDFVAVGGVPRAGGVARLRRDTGELDESFDPIPPYKLDGGNGLNAVVVQPDNKILIAGSLPVPGGALRTNLFRLTESGAFDPSFNLTNIGPDEIMRLALEPDGKIIIVGEFTQIGGQPDAVPVVPPVSRNRIARLLPNGMLDLKFSPGAGANLTVNDVVVQPNGRLMIGGRFTSIDGRPNTMHLARIYEDPPHDPLPCEVPLRSLRVRVSPGGGGLVDYGLASASLDRTCHFDCTTTEYFDGSTVELAATRADANWAFTGWTIDGQPITGNPLRLSLAGNHEVTATFNLICSPGFYSDGGVCTPAAPGYYVPDAGATSPTICPPGYFTASAGSAAPTPADPGFYVPAAGATSQLEVPAGNYAAGPAATSYTLCPGGYFAPEGSAMPTICPAGSYAPAGSAAPIPCPGGYFASEGSAMPTICPAGSYAPGGSAAPILCPGGYFAPEGSAMPTICPAGSYAPAGSATPILCPGGYFAPEGSAVPTICPAGSYAPVGSAAPILCPGGYFASEGSAMPTICPAGSYAPAGSAAPILCPADYYAPQGSAAPIYCPGSPSGSGTCSSLTVTPMGSGDGTVTSNPLGINCGTDCTKFFEPGTVVVLMATPNATSLFVGWGGACSGSGDCVVTMEMARSVTATFNLNAVRVTLNKTGLGTVASDPPGLVCDPTCTTASGYFTRGNSVSLVATPALGWQVTWTVDGVVQFPADPNRLPLELVAGTGDDLAVTAEFNPVIAITAQSGDMTVCAGESTTLSVTAIEPVGSTLNYQWRRDGEPVGENIPTLTVVQAGTYQVVLTLTSGGRGVISSTPIHVRVSQSPVGMADTVLASPSLSVVIPLAALLVNDTDPDGDRLEVIGVDSTSASGGTLIRAAGDSLIYTPPITAPSTDTFHYRVTDGVCPAVDVAVTVRLVASPTTPVNELVIVAAPAPAGAGGGFLLAFTAPGPGTYVLLRAALDATPLIWTVVSSYTATIPGPETFSFSDPSPPGTGAIYRVLQ